MANRNFAPAGGTLEVSVTQLFATVSIGASGATSTLKGQGVTAITKLATGIYQVQLQDPYNRFLCGEIAVESPNTGSPVTAGSFVVGTAYTITTVGTTPWNTAGLATGAPAQVGVPFVATAVGSGTGTATAIGNSGVSTTEWFPGTSTTTGNNYTPTGTVNGTAPAQGGYVYFQCLGPTDATHTALIPTNPASGTVLRICLDLRNSSVRATGE